MRRREKRLKQGGSDEGSPMKKAKKVKKHKTRKRYTHRLN